MHENLSINKPIEQEILSFCQSMASQMERAANVHRGTGWVASDSLSYACSSMAEAYRRVEKHILKEIEIRSSIKSL